MRNIRLTVQYDGTDFFGFQKQRSKQTIQGELEMALNYITHEEIEIVGSGRTDRGVHALGQVVNFHTESSIDPEHFAYILRRMLAPQILVVNSQEVPLSFHARHQACWKKYRYQIDKNAIPDLFQHRYHTHMPNLSVDHIAMQEAANSLIGTHDFTSFCSPKTVVQDRRRTIYALTVERTSLGWQIEVIGNGFLYNMVRIIVGTLIEVGKGQRTSSDILNILHARNRQEAGVTMPPEGLVLVEVGYQDWPDSPSR